MYIGQIKQVLSGLGGPIKWFEEPGVAFFVMVTLFRDSYTLIKVEDSWIDVLLVDEKCAICCEINPFDGFYAFILAN